MPDLRGYYALAQGGVFWLVGAAQSSAAPSIGARLGWRIRTPVALETILELDRTHDATVDFGTKDPAATLTMFRLGPSLRLMTPGRTVRYVAAFGGGLSVDNLALAERVCGSSDNDCLPESSTGVAGFFNLEQGMEVQIGPVVAGFVLQQKMWWLSGAIPDELERQVADGVLFQWVPNASLRLGYAPWRDGARSDAQRSQPSGRTSP